MLSLIGIYLPATYVGFGTNLTRKNWATHDSGSTFTDRSRMALPDRILTQTFPEGELEMATAYNELVHRPPVG